MYDIKNIGNTFTSTNITKISDYSTRANTYNFIGRVSSFMTEYKTASEGHKLRKIQRIKYNRNKNC